MDYDIILVPFNYLTLEKCFQMARISPILDTSLPINTHTARLWLSSQKASLHEEKHHEKERDEYVVIIRSFQRNHFDIELSESKLISVLNFPVI